MTLHPRLFRTLAFVLAIVLTVTLATPAKAEADVLTAIAIGTLVVAGVIIIVYLIVANVAGSKRADPGRPVWVACSGDGCAGLIGRLPDSLSGVSPQAP